MRRLLFLRGKLKGFFFLLHGHRFFSSHLFSFVGSMSALSKWIQQHKKLGHNDFYSFKFDYARREQLFEHVIRQEGLDAAIDYLEFGVYTGSSFCHSIRCCKYTEKLNPKVLNTKFYGFDSFSGFGEISEEDKHPFYTDSNFDTSFENVNNRVKKISKGGNFKLIKGFFNESLKKGANSIGISKSRIIFIDSDTYSSAQEALEFCIPTLQLGTFIILDDFFSYKGSLDKGVSKAFYEFINIAKVEVRDIFTYGMGGKVFVVSKCNYNL